MNTRQGILHSGIVTLQLYRRPKGSAPTLCEILGCSEQAIADVGRGARPGVCHLCAYHAEQLAIEWVRTKTQEAKFPPDTRGKA